MRKPFILLCAVAVACLLATTMPASAAVSESFFTGGNASAGWVSFTPTPSGTGEDKSIALTVTADNGSDFDDFAGVRITGVPAAPPSAEPSYVFRSTVTNAGSGGSPRLVIVFGSGTTVTGTMQLLPLSWTADTWTALGGAGSKWDVTGGSCGFLYQATYADGLACQSGASVLRFVVVSDSGWFNPGGYTHYIDDIKYGDLSISTTDCNRSSAGDLETGPVSAPVHDVVEPAVGGADAGLGQTVHDINCDVVVETLGL